MRGDTQYFFHVLYLKILKYRIYYEVKAAKVGTYYIDSHTLFEKSFPQTLNIKMQYLPF